MKLKQIILDYLKLKYQRKISNFMNGIFIMNVFDLKKVLEIEKASFNSAWTLEAFTYELLVNKKAKYYTYKKNNIIIGYIGFWIFDNQLHITNLAIDLNNRNRGIATKLIEFVLENAKKNKMLIVSLEVRVTNKSAISLYEKIGFVKGEILERYYKIEDGVSMVYYFEEA